jgi:O-antigen/teichoic acid export membrane protein
VNVGVQLVLQAIGILTGAVVSRLLGVDGRGLMALAYAWAAAIAYIGDLGGPIAFTFFAASKAYPLKQLQSNSYWIALGQSVVLALLGIPLIAVVLHGQQRAISITEWFLVAYLPANLLQRYLQGLLQGRNRFLRLGASGVSVQVVYAMIAVPLLIFHYPSVELVLASIIAGNLVAVVIAMGPFGAPARPAALNARLIRDTFAYGLRAHLGNIAPIERLQLDLLIVSAALGPHSAGLYVVAASVASLPRFLGFAIGMVALPQVAEGNTYAHQVQVAASMFRLSVILLLAVAIPLELGVRWLIPLIYGEQFRAATSIAQVLLVAAVAASLRRTLGDCFRGLGQPVKATVSEVAGWVVGATGLLLLVPRFGALGVADAVLICFATSLFTSIVLALRAGFEPGRLLLLRAEDFRAAYMVVRELTRALPLSRGRDGGDLAGQESPLK